MANIRYSHYERTVLSGLFDENHRVRILDEITSNMFKSSDHKLIWDIATGVYSRHSKLGLLTVVEELDGIGRQDLANYVATDITGYVSTGDISIAITEMANESGRDKMKDLVAVVGNMITDEATPEDIVAYIQKNTIVISSESDSTDALDGIVSVGDDMIDAYRREVDNNEFVGPKSLSFGIDRLDKAIGGISGGQVCILAARPGVGKTSVGIQAATECSRRGLHAVMFSYEMTSGEIIERIIMQGFAHVEIAAKSYEDKVKRSIVCMQNNLKGTISIIDNPVINDTKMRTILRKLVARGKCDVVIIDYIQLMRSASRTENRQQELTEISRTIKSIAKELNIPILVLSQFNRRAAEDKEPQLHDLRESGALEQDADKVMLMWEEGQHNDDDDYRKIELNVAKNRQGKRFRNSLCFFPGKQITIDWVSGL